MIISHKHRFIFIRTMKTASTSLEFALCNYLGCDDILTPDTAVDNRRRKAAGLKVCQNNRWSVLDGGGQVFRATAVGGMILKNLLKLRSTAKYTTHMAANRIHELIGSEIWDSYFKFAVERNPFDKAVSHYYYLSQTSHPGIYASFEDYVKSGRANTVSNYDMYSLNGLPAMDMLAKYETLQEDLEEIRRSIGLPRGLVDKFSSTNTKGSYRKKRGYRQEYTDEVRSIVALQMAREIAFFGYFF